MSKKSTSARQILATPSKTLDFDSTLEDWEAVVGSSHHEQTGECALA
jgi:hypothetical protein